MSTSNEDLVTPNTGSTLQANSTPPSNSQVGEPESNALGINSNEGQQPAHNNEATTGNEGHVPGTSGDFLIANAALASCNTILKGYRSSRISKGTALCRIYTILLEAVSDDESTPAKHSAVFSPLLRIIRDISQKPNAMDVVNIQKVPHIFQRGSMTMKNLKTSHLLNEQNLMTQNTPGLSLISYMVLHYLCHSLNPLSYSNSMLLI